MIKPEEEIAYPEHTSLSQLADSFGDYFSLKIEKIRHDLDELNVQPLDLPVTTISNEQKMKSFAILSNGDISKLLAKAPDKQCASDPIPTWLLKKCSSSLLPCLTTLVNSSLQSGYFASEWKTALVAPLLKNRV